MFRKMRRIKQQISQQECIDILINEPRGVLSLIGDDGYPYGIPLNHWYSEKDGKLYFHGSKKGHKADAISKCNKVSYCVYDSGFRKDGDWALNIKSVVVFGKIEFVEDKEKTIEICKNLCLKFTDDKKYMEHELKRGSNYVMCLELTPEHMTGKLVNES